LFVLCFFFFFQAEDGIRDRNVTGVQTCALPISYALPVLGRRGYGSVGPIRAARKERCEHAALKLRCRRGKAGGATGGGTTSPKEIGRASCRERVEISVVDGAGKRRKVTQE